MSGRDCSNCGALSLQSCTCGPVHGPYGNLSPDEIQIIENKRTAEKRFARHEELGKAVRRAKEQLHLAEIALHKFVSGRDVS